MPTLTRPQPTITPLGDGHFLVTHTPYIAEIRKQLSRESPHDGMMSRIRTAYVGVADWKEGEQVIRAVLAEFPKSDLMLRPSQRLQTPFEVKIRGIAALEFERFFQSFLNLAVQ